MNYFANGALFTAVCAHRHWQLELKRCQWYLNEHNIELCETRPRFDLRCSKLTQVCKACSIHYVDACHAKYSALPFIIFTLYAHVHFTKILLSIRLTALTSSSSQNLGRTAFLFLSLGFFKAVILTCDPHIKNQVKSSLAENVDSASQRFFWSVDNHCA